MYVLGMGKKSDRRAQRQLAAKARECRQLADKAAALRLGNYQLAENAYKELHKLIGGEFDRNFFNKPKVLEAEESGLALMAAILWYMRYAELIFDPAIKERSLTALHRIQSLLIPLEIMNRCHDLHAVISLYLNKIGCPAIVIRGTIAASAPGTSGFVLNTATEAIDQKYKTGHSWLVTPYWWVVDLSLAHQENAGDDYEILKNKIPPLILIDGKEMSEPNREWWRWPGEKYSTITDEEYVQQTRFFKLLGWSQLQANDLTIRYLPFYMSLPESGEAEDMNKMKIKIAGMGPEDFFNKYLADLM